jgi:hypothetical protein
MKHQTFYPDLTPPKKPLWQRVLNVLYFVAVFVVFILLWTGL